MPEAPDFEIDVAKKYRATVTTGRGTMVMELDPALAPSTVNNFVALARQGFYDGLTFHRVILDGCALQRGFRRSGAQPLERNAEIREVLWVQVSVNADERLLEFEKCVPGVVDIAVSHRSSFLRRVHELQVFIND